MPRIRSSLAKCWCFTLNNPDIDCATFNTALTTEWPLSYAVFQHETGEDGTRHFQGYCEFRSKVRLTAIKKLPHGARMHLEVRRGTRIQAREYSMKEDTRLEGPYEIGQWSETGQGTRSDLSSAIEVMQTQGLRACAEQHPSTVVRFHRGLQFLQSLTTPARSDDFKVSLLYGPPRCGKTRQVYDAEALDDLWRSPAGQALQWFDGYEDHPAALLDDFDGKLSKASLQTTLQVLDRYPIRVPIKGGFVHWNPSRVYITTNYHPREWYDWSTRGAQYPALYGRIHEVFYWFEASPTTPMQCIHLTPTHPSWESFFTTGDLLL